MVRADGGTVIIDPLDPAVAEVLLARRRWAIVRGESLRLLRGMPDACVDAVATDSPYSSGGMTRGDRMAGAADKYVPNNTKIERADFAGDNRDQRAFGYWCALWCAELLRIAKPGSPIALFTDWRQLPTTTDALQAGGWVWRGIVPWDKTEGCRPTMGRFAAQCEYAVWGSAGPMDDRVEVGCLPGIARTLEPPRPLDVEIEEARAYLEQLEAERAVQSRGFPVSVRNFPKPSEKNHMTSKTPTTMQSIVRICVPGGVILDPFFGGGSTGVAALREGRRVIGFEITETNHAAAVLAMQAEEAVLKPAAMAAGQLGLYGR